MGKGAKVPTEPKGLRGLEAKLRDVKPPTFGRYLRRELPAFTAVIDRLGHHWDVIADWVYDTNSGLGLRDKGGQRIKPATLKKAYDRERLRLKKKGEPAPVTTAKPPAAKSAPPVRMIPEPEQPKSGSDPLDQIRKAARAAEPWNNPKKGSD